MSQALTTLFPEHDWIALTNQQAELQKSVTPVPAPVRPLSAVLPLYALTFEEFQDFCASLLGAYYDGATIHQYGGPGDKQRGIDIDARLKNGSYYTYQCKRETKFGKEKVRKAIQKHSVTCDLAIIFLSRPATVGARDEVKKKRKKKWDIWDAKDIADRIRALPEHRQLRLIDTYFPAYRKDFLGIDQPSAFETPEKYFEPFLTRSHIFSHAWTLVGRDGEVELINDALLGVNEGAIVIAGAGGIGKTRLLRAVIDRYLANHSASSVFVLPSTAQPTPKDYEIVAGQENLIVLEDTHDRLDTKAVAHALARIKPQPRVIVTSRPYSLSATCGDLESVGLRVAPGFPLSIAGLTKPEAEAVAREILKAKNGPEAAAKDIADVSYDSPLALVVGAHLVATKLIHPKTLNNAEEFRRRILQGFRDAITGSIGLPAEATLIGRTLELIALLQPLEIDTNSFVGIASKLNNQPVGEVKRAIQLLLEAGVLVRRARKLRIVPDLLGDYLIEEVLRRDGDMPSEVAKQLLALADADQVARLLVNTAKLDWRLSAKDESNRRLSDAIWNQLTSESSGALPKTLRDGVVVAAYYQPDPALRWYDRIAREGDSKEYTRLLKHIAMNMEMLEQACERLWTLSKKDGRQENQFPDHPLRILKELGHVEPGKPVDFCHRVATFAMTRISGRHDSLDLYGVLESGLKPDGHATESHGLSISLNRFTVRHAAVKELRNKIIAFLLQNLTAPLLPSAVRAARTLYSALRYPDHEQPHARKEWEADFVSTLDQLAAVTASGDLDENTLVAVEKSVHWHARYGAGLAHDAALRVIDAIPKTLEYRVTLCIVDQWGDTRMGPGDAQDWIDRWRKEQESVAKDVLKEYAAPDAVVAFIRKRLEAIRGAENLRDNAPAEFVGALAYLDQGVAEALCEAAMSDAEMRIVFSAGLNALMQHNPVKGIAVAQRALSANALDLTRDVSWSLSLRQGRQKTLSEERAMLVPLLSHMDSYIAGNAIRGIVRGGLHDPASLADHLLTLNLGQSKSVASEFFGEVTRHEMLAQALTAPAVVPRMLEKLKELPSIEDFWIEKYLAKVAEASPLEVTELLIARIEGDVADTEHKLQPLPYLWDEKPPFASRKSADFKAALRRIREWLLTAPDHWAVRFWAPKLYAAMAGGIDDEVVRDLLEWTATYDPRKFNIVVGLLQAAPSAFVLNHISAVRDLFDRAEAVGCEAVAGLRSSLFAAAISGGRHGTVGQPFPEDVEQKTKSQEALAQVATGSPVAEFYAALVRNAERDIRSKKEQDDALMEEHE